MQTGALLALNDLEFLQALVQRYPESGYLAGKAESSPEGTPVLRQDALAYQVFGVKTGVDATAIEADRTFLGLLTLKWVLTDQYNKFTSLQPPSIGMRLRRSSFHKLRDYTLRIINSDADLEFCLYSLTCNDLGKTLFLVEQHQNIIGQPAENHDLLLYRLTQKMPELFPAFQSRLTDVQQHSYLAGLGADLNLGQFVQGENLPVNLAGMQALDAKSRELRLVCELFDFAGVTGHLNAEGSMVMHEDNYLAFSTAIAELIALPLPQAYQRYIHRRGTLAGIDMIAENGYALGRLTTLSRSFTPEQGTALQAVWHGLSPEQKTVLSDELNETGDKGRKGILLYYAPALIANAIAATGDYTAGLNYALPILAQVYQTTRTDMPAQNGNGIITVNIARHAREAQQLAKEKI